MAKSYKFNPGFQSDDEAVSSFIVRLEELNEIMASFSRSSSLRPRVLVVAPRGAGKTTLCKRVLAEVRLTAELDTFWQTIFLGEESYTITTPGEFFLECLFHLKEQFPKTDLGAKYESVAAIANEAELLQRSLQILRAFSRVSGKRLLIVVENFHTILHDQIGLASKSLIEKLSDTDLFGVLATSVAQFQEDDEDPLLGDFLKLKLKPLSLQECHLLWTALTAQQVNQERIRPLQILTGGSPRLLHILAEFMRTPSLHDLMENLNLLIDQNTEYFKSQLDALPAGERKVFAALLDAWDPSTAKQISDAARVSTNIASAMLARLSDRGAVIKEPGQGRTAIYYAAERLFNIYYLMRRRSHPSRRMRALVTFMTEYYDRDELVDTTAKLVREACLIEPGNRSDYHSTFSAILVRAPEAVRTRILEQTPADFLHYFQEDQTLSRRDDLTAFNRQIRSVGEQADDVIEEIFKNAHAATEDGKFEHARSLLIQATGKRPKLAEPWLRLAMIEIRLGKLDKALEAAEKAVSLDVSGALGAFGFTVLGMVQSVARRFENASQSLSQAIELDSTSTLALTELAEVRRRQGKAKDAIHLYRRALESGAMTDSALARFGRLLQKQGESAEAEAILRRSTGTALEQKETRRALVDLLNATNRSNEAVMALRASAEETDSWESWADLGSFLLLQGYDSDARQALTSAVERNAENPTVYRMLALAIRQEGGSPEEATAIADRVTQRFPDEAAAWMAAGDIYRMNQQVNYAEDAYRKAITFEEGEVAWLLLGRLLFSMPRREVEAEDAMRRAIEVAHGSEACGPLKELAEVMIHRGEDTAASRLLAEAISKNKACYCSLTLQGEIAARSGNKFGARKHFETALKVEPNGIAALIGLARVSDQRAAEKLIANAVAAEPGDPRCLLARGQLGSRTLEERLEDGQEALELEPEFTEAHLFLAPLKLERGDSEEALQHLAAALKDLPSKREIIPVFVDTALNLTNRGMGLQISSLLQAQEAGKMVEPLAVALKIARGEQPTVAKEVLEVANDIANRLSSLTIHN